MMYGLEGWAGTGHYLLPLEQDEYNRIRVAKRRLSDALQIEEKYGMLLENYREFKQSLLDSTLEYMLFDSPAAWQSMISMIYQNARRVTNLLSTARLYVDQSVHDLKSIYGDGSDTVAAFKSWKNEQYDGLLGYRAMEALRNYMQHRGLPVRSISVGGQWRGEANVFTVRINLVVAELRRDPEFKQEVLEQLEAIGPQVPLKKLVREYIQGLATVQARLRQMWANDLKEWERDYLGGRERFVAEFPGTTDYMSLIARDEDGRTESEDIFEEPLKRRQMLEKRNSKGQQFTRVISSE
jgi:hypothetical protein